MNASSVVRDYVPEVVPGEGADVNFRRGRSRRKLRKTLRSPYDYNAVTGNWNDVREIILMFDFFIIFVIV